MPRAQRKPTPSKGKSDSPQGLLSLRAYARSRKERGLDGGTLAAVQKAIEAGRIETVDDGGRWPKIDPAVADAAWRGNTAERRDQVNVVTDEDDGSTSSPSGTVAGERKRTEAVKRELLELELEQKKGELVNAADVKREAFSRGRELRDRILNVPARVAAQLAATTDPREVEAQLDVELRTALQELVADG